MLTVVRFHCLFCHGYEEKNVKSAGVLAVGDIANPFGALHLARMAKRLTPNVTIYTDGADELAQKTAEAAIDDDIKVESKTISRLEKGEQSSVIMHFKDGQTFTEGFLVSIPAFSSQRRPKFSRGSNLLTILIGSQAQERSQRAVCASIGLGIDGSRRHQDQRCLLRDQRVRGVRCRGLRDAVEGGNASSGDGFFWGWWFGFPTAGSTTQGQWRQGGDIKNNK